MSGLFCLTRAEECPSWDTRKEFMMMNYLEIEKVIGREILDSRGNPTVEAKYIWQTGRSGEEPRRAGHPPVSSRRWN